METDVARPTNTSTGMCAAGATVPALSLISPASHWPTAIFETLAVMVRTRLPPGASVNREGVTVRPMFVVGFTVDTVHVALVVSALVTVRVHVHVAWHPEFARLGMLSVVGSPPVDG